MTYATVMVGLSVDRPNDVRLEIAAQLAERFRATVVGVTAAEFSPPLHFTSGEQAQKLVDLGLGCDKKPNHGAGERVSCVSASELLPDQRGEAGAQLDRIASDLGAGVVVAGA